MMLTAETNEMSLGFPFGEKQWCVKLMLLSLRTKIKCQQLLNKT